MAEQKGVDPDAMKIHSAEFVKSSTTLSQCPDMNIPEYAFIGRSNVGKSSLINMLLGRKSLAKTSGKPGKTRTINHFLINDEWLLADLPGYGYAKVSKKERESWTKMIWNYLRHRDNLACIMVLVDSRHDPQDIDIEMINRIGSEGLPLIIVRTKADKMKAGALARTGVALNQELAKDWGELPLIVTTSSESHAGREELLRLIQDANQRFGQDH